MARRRSLVCALTCVLLAGCAQAELTELLVVVDTDLPVPSELASVRFRVVGPQGDERAAVASFASGEPRPAVLALVHRGGPLGPFTIEVSGVRGAGEVVRERTARVSFVERRVMVLSMALLARCGDVACDAEETCAEAGCRSIDVSPSELVPYEGTTSGLDAAMGDGGTARPCALDADCDDGIACTLDACELGFCASVPNDSLCPSDALDCTRAACDPSRGCVQRADDARCDDGVACTVDRCDATGGCVASPDDARCDDGVACTVDTCDAALGCASAPDDARCDDAIACTVDACDAVLGCASAPDDARCDDGVACTIDACDETMGCVATADDTRCDDGIGCTVDACDARAGCGASVSHASCADGEYCSPTTDCVRGPTFTEVYALLQSKCAPCHTTRADGGLDLSTAALAWSSLVGVTATCGGGANVRVIPRDGARSLLYRKVARVDLCGSRMPPSGSPMSSADVQLIRQWIEAGALND